MAQVGGRPAVGVMITFRQRTSPRPRVFHLPAPVGVEEVGRRAACPEPLDSARGKLCRRGVRSCERRCWV